MGYVYTSKIYFDFPKRIIPHTLWDLLQNVQTSVLYYMALVLHAVVRYFLQ